MTLQGETNEDIVVVVMASTLPPELTSTPEAAFEEGSPNDYRL